MNTFGEDTLSQQPVPELPETLQFFDQLIDDRGALSKTLQPLAEHHYDAARLTGNFYTIPDFLLPYVPADSTGAEISLAFGEKDGELQLEKVRAELHDGPVLDIRTDGPFSILTVSEDHENAIMFPGATACEDTLRSLIPPMEDEPEPDLLAAAKVFYQLSAHSSHNMVVNRDGNIFRHLEVTTDTERKDCTIVTKVVPDPIGKVAVTATILETADVEEGGMHTAYDVNMVYGDEDNAPLEAVVNRPEIRVENPAGFHTEALEDSVDMLLDETIPVSPALYAKAAKLGHKLAHPVDPTLE